jgi:hypothetical protein
MTTSGDEIPNADDDLVLDVTNDEGAVVAAAASDSDDQQSGIRNFLCKNDLKRRREEAQ